MFREKRFKFFKDLLSKIDKEGPIEILDIGGTQEYWQKMNFIDNTNCNITLLNLEKVEVKYTNFKSVVGDAKNLIEYKDKQFDVVFSNSVIEHLYSRENQICMANEVMRVGKYYYVQTPNYYFPIEPHWLFPFFQFLPFGIRVYLTENFTIGNVKKAINKAAAINKIKEVNLLSEKELIRLFPNSEIKREYFLGLVKSISAYRVTE